MVLYAELCKRAACKDGLTAIVQHCRSLAVRQVTLVSVVAQLSVVPGRDSLPDAYRQETATRVCDRRFSFGIRAIRQPTTRPMKLDPPGLITKGVLQGHGECRRCRPLIDYECAKLADTTAIAENSCEITTHLSNLDRITRLR